jgi:hypothetical protein
MDPDQTARSWSQTHYVGFVMARLKLMFAFSKKENIFKSSSV